MIGVDSQKLHFGKARQHSLPYDSRVERLEVESSVSSLEHFLYWLPRVGAALIIWVCVWTYASAANLPIRIDNPKSAIPLVFVILGCLLGSSLPAWSIMSRNNRYIVTDTRVIVFNCKSSRYRFVKIADIERTALVEGYRSGCATVTIEAGAIEATDGFAPMRLRLVAAEQGFKIFDTINKLLKTEAR